MGRLLVVTHDYEENQRRKILETPFGAISGV